MAREWKYTPLQTRVMDLVKKRLLKEFRDRGIKISGGIYIKPKPKKVRLDVIELNCLGPYDGEIQISKSIYIVVNINYQDEDYDKVKSYVEFLSLALFDSMLSKNLIIKKSYDEWDYQIYRISPYLWLGNCPILINHINKKNG